MTIAMNELDQINTINGISNYLNSIESFKELVKARKLHATTNELQEFIVLGCLFLAASGGAMTIIDRDRYKPIFDNLGKVVPLVYFKTVHPEVYISYSLSGTALPGSDARCSVCRIPVTLEGLGQSLIENKSTVSHIECIVRSNAIHYRNKFTTAVLEAGIVPDLIETKNEYWNQESPPTGPWFIQHFGFVGQVRMGWRKNVIELNWGMMGQHMGKIHSNIDLFRQEKKYNSTFANNYVHCGDYSNLTEYLNLINKIIQ